MPLRLPGQSANAPASRDLGLHGSRVGAFVRAGGTERYEVRAGTRYESRSICLLPEFLEQDELADVSWGADADGRRGTSFERLAAMLGRLRPEALPHELADALARLDPAGAPRPGSSLHARAQVYEALAALADHARDAARTRARRGSREQRRLVAQARELVDASLGEPMTLEGLAGRLYVGRSPLCEAFRQETGESLGRYVRRRRMERACELLACDDAPVAEVARAVGYAHQGSFTGVFEREVGMTPTAWRAARRG